MIKLFIIDENGIKILNERMKQLETIYVKINQESYIGPIEMTLYKSLKIDYPFIQPYYCVIV